MRLPFLILTPICVFLGIATAVASGASVEWQLVPVVLAAAVAAHISVNTLNEYADFRSGLDLTTRRTPFSGGSGAIPANPAALNAVLLTGLLCLAITMGCGIYLATVRGWELIFAGVIGVALVLFYTPWINRLPLLCLIAPGLGFGVLMVVGSHWVLVGNITLQAIMASLVPFMLVNNLLLLNQFPDVDADRAAGRRHILIVYGTYVGAGAYASAVVGCSLVVILGYVFNIWNTWALLSILPLFAAVGISRVVLRDHATLGERTDVLGVNVAITLLTPLLLAVGIVL
ncbi:prenyltransferase [Aurantivibrio plasticivorans]